LANIAPFQGFSTFEGLSSYIHFWWKHVGLWYQILLKSSRVVATKEQGGAKFINFKNQNILS